MKEQLSIEEVDIATPLRRWRNYAVCVRSWEIGTRIYQEGVIYPGEYLHATKHEAVMAVTAWMEQWPGWVEYLGTFEEAA